MMAGNRASKTRDECAALDSERTSTSSEQAESELITLLLCVPDYRDRWVKLCQLLSAALSTDL